MKAPDSQFEDLFRKLPKQKLSRSCDRRIKAIIRQACHEISDKRFFWDFTTLFRPLLALPMTLAVILVMITSYGFTSAAVVKGDTLYVIKTRIETALYPQNSSSERRVDYHLWLSERRYSEVNEILGRLGKEDMLTLIPHAQAQDLQSISEDDPLYSILMETFQSATQHVDLAFLIADEVQEVDRVDTLKNVLRQSLEKQRDFLVQVTPALEDIKLHKKMRPRLRRLERERIAQERANETLVTKSIPVAELSVLPELEPENEKIDEYQLSRIDQGLSKPEKKATIDVQFHVFSEFVEDRIAFQESLLKSIDETVQLAQEAGVDKVDLSVEEEISTEDIVSSNDASKVASEPVLREALVIHLDEKQKLILIEIAEINNVLEKNDLQALVPPPPAEGDTSKIISDIDEKLDVDEDLEVHEELEKLESENSLEMRVADASETFQEDDLETLPLVPAEVADSKETNIEGVEKVPEAFVDLPSEDETVDISDSLAVHTDSTSDGKEFFEIQKQASSELSSLDFAENMSNPVLEKNPPDLSEETNSVLVEESDFETSQSLLKSLLENVSDSCRDEVRKACLEDITSLCFEKASSTCEAALASIQKEEQDPIVKDYSEEVSLDRSGSDLEPTAESAETVIPEVLERDAKRLEKLKAELKSTKDVQDQLAQ